MSCPACGELHGGLANTGRDEQFDPAFYKLERIEGFRRCTVCRTYFNWVDRPQFYGSGNLDEEEYDRLTPEQSALLDRLLPVDPQNPGDLGPVAAYFSGLPEELLLKALSIYVFRWKVMQPFVPELVRRLAETANPELFSLLQNYRYQSRERAREVWTLLEAVEYQPHSVRLLEELRKKCEELRKA